MTRSRDPLELGPHWHVDCRLEAELPEDNVIGRRFLINALFGSVTLALMLFTGWMAYMSFSLRSQIRDWDRRITDNREEVREIQRLQGEYFTEAKKIDQAYALMKSPLFLSGFTARLGQTLPPQMMINAIESNGPAILVRGTIDEPYEAAKNLFSSYLGRLRGDAEIGPLFESIKESGTERIGETKISFQVTFQRKPLP